MKYVCGKEAKFHAISGFAHFQRGMRLESIGSFLYIIKDGKEPFLVCAKESQNARDYFALDEDGFGLKRFDAREKILEWVRVKKEQNAPELRKFFDKINKTVFVIDGFWTEAFFNANYLDLMLILSWQKECSL